MLMATSLTLSMLEIILLFFGAVVLGITVHFFIASRKSLREATMEAEETNIAKNEWKKKYLNDMEALDKELVTLRQKLSETKQQLLEAEENVNIYSIEAEEMRLQNKRLEKELESKSQQAVHVPLQQPTSHKGDNYLDQLLLAQSSLMEHNQKINELLGNIEIIKEKEEKQRQILRDNEELSEQISNIRAELSEKEKEIANIRQKEHLTKEMSSMLDSAYSEFNTLQGKIQKMESQLTTSRMANLHYEDLKEEHSNLKRDFEEQKLKLNAMNNENQQLHSRLTETEDKLRDSNFQRQQLQKRITYLEELNKDFQVVSEANKKLENQLKRIGELESMLNVVSEERDHLLQRKQEE